MSLVNIGFLSGNITIFYIIYNAYFSARNITILIYKLALLMLIILNHDMCIGNFIYIIFHKWK